MKCKKIDSARGVYEILVEFQDVFPHLMEKISSLEDYAEKLYQYAEVYIGIKNENTFGVLIFYANDKKTQTAYISLIGVKEQYRHQRLGEWLLETCISKSRDAGMKTLKLEVDLDNANGKQFYERNGFVYGEDTGRDSIYMEISI